LTSQLNIVPKERKTREAGRESTGCWKAVPRDRWVREGGRWSMGWLNVSCTVRWVREDGRRESIGWLKLREKMMAVHEERVG
jgi:hypothetical protein